MLTTPRHRRPIILAAIMVTSFMIAIEVTIVATAMPQIVGHLGGLKLYAWVFAAFLLAQTATTVVFGKLSDLYGRKPVLLFGIAIFLVGSLLCGFAWSMPSLIAFRLVQGFGAGAVQPVSMTLIGDLYSVQERGKVQGYLASVWGISSLVGPLAGGLIVQHVHWAWIFWINIPVAIIAAALFIPFLHENVQHEKRSVDVPGAILFAVAVAALMIGLTDIGNPHGMLLWVSAAIFLGCAALFLVQERRAADPMVSLSLWGHRPIASANAACLLSSMALMGLTTFLPMYVQAVMSQSALVAAFTLSAMVLSWPIGAIIAARNFHRFGLRAILLFGAALLPAGAVVFVLFDPKTSVLIAGFGSLVMGFGMGFVTNASLVIVQESVSWAQRGSATASNLFARSLGSTLGATVLGALLNFSLVKAGARLDSNHIRDLIEHKAGGFADPALQDALAHGLQLTFWGIFVISVLALAVATLVPRITLRQGHADDAVDALRPA